MRLSTTTKGYLLGIIAAATYGMNPLFALPLYDAGMTADSVLFFRYLFAIPILASMLKIRGRGFKVNLRQGSILAALGIVFALSSLTLFLSYNYMDAGIASTLLFVYPLLVAVIMALFFREKMSVQMILCLVTALVGIALLYRGADGATLSLTGTLLVFGSSLSYAIYIVAVNRSGLDHVPTLKLTFYVLLFGLTLFLARVLMQGELQCPPHWYLWGNLLALALFPTAISLLCTTQAIQYIGSTPTAILGALEPVTAVFFGITVFGEVVTPRNALGMVLIIVSVTIVVGGGSMPRLLNRLRKMFPRLTRKRA